MAIAILSPCVLDIGNMEEIKHCYKLGELIDYINKNTNLEFQYYKRAPYDGYKMEVPRYRNMTLNNYIMTNVYSKIMNNIDSEYIELTNIEPAKPLNGYDLPEGEITTSFLSYINYIQDEESVVFLGPANMSIECPLKFMSESEFQINASKQFEIETTEVLVPFLNENVNLLEIFPRKNACKSFNSYVKDQERKNNMCQNQRISLFEKIGCVVAKYNFYKRNQRLSSLNSNGSKIRQVYEKEKGKKYFLSLDVESGGFEVFDNHYNHLGQVNFSCEFVKRAEPHTHILKH